MNENARSQKNDRAALKTFLQQYHLALRQKDILDDRRDQLNVKLASATDIDARIKRQQEHLARILSDIMDVIDILPPNSPGRTVIEMRHIDCMSWTKIADSLYMSRSNAFNCYESALDDLLNHKSVNEKIKKISRKNPRKH
jgi:hypothetical protein|nr:MAG TPA: Protein of unknown function (DUF1492) [Caudoviricetes sp.]